MNELRKLCNNFINQTNITVEQFCKKIRMSRENYYMWQRCERELTPKSIKRIEEYLSSTDAQDLLAKGKKYLPISECSKLLDFSVEKIRKLCQNGTIDAMRSAGNRWFVNIDNLTQYASRNSFFRSSIVSRPEDQELAFGNLQVDFDIMWKPMSSTHNDYEIFDSDIHEYANQYLIANNGIVYNISTERVLGVNHDADNYVRVNLLKYKDREHKETYHKTCYVHDLVAYFFCPNGKYKEHVHHIDRDKNNNSASNLIWVTPAEHKICHQLMDADKKAYRKYINQLKKENKW